MKGVLLPIAAWPNIHYMYYVARGGTIFVEQHETYPRQTYRNRYEILTANGVLPLTIPVRRSGNHTKTSDVLIDYSSDWQTQHWRAITSAYRNSPFFEFFEHDVYRVFASQQERLLDYDLSQIKLLCKLLRIGTTIQLTTQFEKNPRDLKDKRFVSDPRTGLEADADVAELFQKRYYQTFENKFAFTPNLSGLDILFNLGLKATDFLVQRNHLSSL